MQSPTPTRPQRFELTVAPERLMSGIAAGPLTLRPLSPVIGAEVGGVDLTAPLDPATVAHLHQALLTWGVLFFRDQDITTQQQVAFASAFGDLEVHPFIASRPDHPEVVTFNRGVGNRARENIWHSDVTWREIPSFGSVLRAVEVPPVGGDTLFACMYSAYEGLSAEVKARIDGRLAINDSDEFRRAMQAKGATAAEVADFAKRYPPRAHPVVRTHPETGRKLLYVNRAFTRRIVGMEAEESARLLEHLFAQAAIPEHQCRFRWTPNAIAFWDNRAVQHYAVSDYWPAVRRMERVTIIGDRPF